MSNKNTVRAKILTETTMAYLKQEAKVDFNDYTIEGLEFILSQYREELPKNILEKIEKRLKALNVEKNS